MNDINVTMNLSTEDRARLDRIIAALENSGTLYQAPAAQEPEKPAEMTPEVEPQVNTQPEPEPVKEEAKPAPTATKADIRTMVVKLVGAKKKDGVEKIIKSFAPSVTDLPDDKLDEVMAQLKALEVEA